MSSKKICKCCGKKSDSVKKCLACFSVSYCAISCQQKDWPKHKTECLALATSRIEKNVKLMKSEKFPEKGVKIVANRNYRSGDLVLHEFPLLKYNGSCDPSSCVFKWDTLYIENSLSAYSKLSSEKKSILMKEFFYQQNRRTTPTLERLFKKHFELFKKYGLEDESDAKKFMLILKYNDLLTFRKCQTGNLDVFIGETDHEEEEEKDEPLSTLYRYVSKVNHSCQPNCNFIVQKNGTCCVYAMDEIREGDEITISYVPEEQLIFPTTIRKEMINDKFLFRCVCDRCESSRSKTEICRCLFCDECQRIALFFTNEDVSSESTCVHCYRKYPENLRMTEVTKLQPRLFRLFSGTPLHKLVKEESDPNEDELSLEEIIEKAYSLYEKTTGVKKENFVKYWGSALLHSEISKLYRVKEPNNIEKRIELNQSYLQILEFYQKQGGKFGNLEMPKVMIRIAELLKKSKKKKEALGFYEKGAQLLEKYYGKDFHVLKVVEKVITKLKVFV